MGFEAALELLNLLRDFSLACSIALLALTALSILFAKGERR